MVAIPILSVLTYSTSSPHDIMKVSKQIDHNLPFGPDELVDRVPVGFTCRFFVSF